MFERLWADDAGGVVAAEYTLVGAVAVLGTVPALIVVREASSRMAESVTAPMERVIKDADRYAPPAPVVRTPAPAPVQPVVLPCP